MYQPLHSCSLVDCSIRHLRYRVRTWGCPSENTAPLFLLHGWMDTSASWQFVVDAFSQAWRGQRLIVAPDWRGFGHSMPPQPCDHYTFADYLGDLDTLLDVYALDGQPVDLVGHSMGGNVAMLYAGARPARVRRLVNLEGFGLPANHPRQAPRRLSQWMDELRRLHAGEVALKTYENLDAVAARLCKTNHRLSVDRALWLAKQWSATDAHGRWRILGDDAHKVINPQLFRVDEVLACYAAITAPVLSVEGSDDSLSLWWKDKFSLSEYYERLHSVAEYRIVRVENAGHMLHHDQPQAVASLIENFCA